MFLFEKSEKREKSYEKNASPYKNKTIAPYFLHRTPIFNNKKHILVATRDG